MFKKPKLDPSTRVEVVMRKEITLADYPAIQSKARAKGWVCQAYQIGILKPIEQ